MLLVVALGMLASCGTDSPPGGPGTPCTRSSDCLQGLMCTPEGCEGANAEAGESDGGNEVDSSAPDASRTD